MPNNKPIPVMPAELLETARLLDLCDAILHHTVETGDDPDWLMTPAHVRRMRSTVKRLRDERTKRESRPA